MMNQTREKTSGTESEHLDRIEVSGERLNEKTDMLVQESNISVILNLCRGESSIMPEPDPARIMTFVTPKDLGRWLKVNHASESELWVKIFKKKSGTPSVTWADIVIEALCWGWIDGVKKSIDDQAYFQRMTPRKARSNWSNRNRGHAEHLISEGRMTESGLVHIRAAKVDGRWENAYVASEMKVPADFLAALESKPKAKQFFETL
jgi:uncharacterized protein YdeI (YjbR/CyaY-like superfamily)